MKKNYALTIVLLLVACLGKPQEMGKDFQKFEGYYFFSAQLKRMEKFDIPNNKSIWFGRLDVKTSKLDLINGESWKVEKILDLAPYKDNVFFIKGYDSLFINLDPDTKNDSGQHNLVFINDKNKPKSFDSLISSGFFVYNIKSIEDCKKHLSEWKKEAEETNCDTGDCYGKP